MKTFTLKFFSLIILVMIGSLVSELRAQGQNCNVSAISGSSVLVGQGIINQTYSVTSSGNHVWSLPPGATQISGTNNSITVQFNSAFNAGMISVRRTGNCINYQHMYVTRQVCDIILLTSNDTTVFFGYQPFSCVGLSASASNGTPPYSFQWSDGQSGDVIYVCPEVSTTYTVEVTDANGCTMSAEIDVCVIDVRCYAGNSSNQKVEICHNGHTICVDENAVSAHLAHGDVLGECNEGCSTELYGITYHKPVNVFPNPANEILNISIDQYLIGTGYTIYDMQGKIISNGIFQGSNESIPVSSLAPGIYMLRSSTGEIVRWNKR